MKTILLILICSADFLFAESAQKIDWKDLIFIPSVTAKPDALVAGTNNNTAIESSMMFNIPSWILSIHSGILVPPPISKFKVQYPLGLGFTGIKGFDMEFMAVFPAILRASVGYFFYYNDPRFSRVNIALYTGVSIQSTGGEFFASLFTLNKYAPSIGFRSLIRRKKYFSGFVFDNKYEFIFDGSGHLRILLTVGYFVPL